MKKIAIVEDNPDNRLLLQAMLEDDYEIREYETGTEAVAGIRREPPDLVLLDISLPGMDGTEVLEVLRRDADLRDLPVIALTAHAMAGDREKYLAAGFNDYISKPIVEEEVLFGAIARLLADGTKPAGTPTETRRRSEMEDLQAYYRSSLKDRIETLEAVRDALARRDSEAVEAVRRTAHSLKGTGSSFGFPEVTRAAQVVLDAPDSAVSETAAAMIEILRRVAAGGDAR
jgi:CheY-like chemotaxis protein/HPt (histidine-containing phosphotransfer) domain-containing protein